MRNSLQLGQLLEPLDSTPRATRLNYSPVWWVGCMWISKEATVCTWNRVYWRKLSREELSMYSALSSHHAAERWVWARQSWTAHASPYNTPHIYVSGDGASWLPWNNMALGSGSGCVRNKEERSTLEELGLLLWWASAALLSQLSAGTSRAIQDALKRINTLYTN